MNSADRAIPADRISQAADRISEAVEGTPAAAVKPAAEETPGAQPTPVDRVFTALGDPVRRRILELLGDAGERSAGEIADLLHDQYRISQPATSQHLRVLRETGLVTVRPAGRQRMYAVDPPGLAAAAEWIARFADPFAQPLDALETELARGKRERRRAQPRTPHPRNCASPGT